MDIFAWHLAMFLLASHFYLWDAKEGSILRRLYIGFHNWTSSKDNTISLADKQGFVYGQKARQKLFVATIFSLKVSVVLFFIPNAIELVYEIIFFFTKTATVFLGFLAGPMLAKFYFAVRTLMGFVDKVESSEINIHKEITDAADSAKTRVVKAARDIVDDARELVISQKKTPAKEKIDEKKKATAEKKAPPIPDEEALDFLSKFSGNKKEAP